MILITGGTGYIGSHTAVKLLEQNEDIIMLDNLYNSNISVIDKIEAITNKRPEFIKQTCLINRDWKRCSRKTKLTV